MRDDFIAIFGSATGAEHAHYIRTLADAGRAGFCVAVEQRDLIVIADRRLPIVLLPNDRGIILGDMFGTGAIDAYLTSAPGPSLGRLLIDHCWGRYVAILSGADGSAHILRDPSGAIRCYHGTAGRLSYACSDPMLAVNLRLLQPAIDWQFMRHFLAYPHLPTARTGLTGLTELLPGCCVRPGVAGEPVLSLWRPAALAERGSAIDEPAIASTMLRNTVHAVSNALAARFDHILLELSGGLDSSIIAAGLAFDTKKVDALNIATPSVEGDERAFARAVASHFGYRLAEHVVAPPRDVDLRHSPAARAAKPGAHSAAQKWDAALRDQAFALSADAYFSGTGGDNVFCSLATAAPVADRLLRPGSRSRVFETLRDVANVHGCTLWTAGRLALRQVRRAGHARDWPRDVRFLNPDAVPARPDDHPWLREDAPLLPGSRGHIRSLMVAHAHMHGADRQRFAPLVFPLLAQPVVELCLRIPSWLWVRGGRERAVARDAFDGELPAAVINRTTKGMMNSYCAELFASHRSMIAEILLDGALAREGILDRVAIEAAMAISAPLRGDDYFRLLSIADVEAWGASWRQPAGQTDLPTV